MRPPLAAMRRLISSGSSFEKVAGYSRDQLAQTATFDLDPATGATETDSVFALISGLDDDRPAAPAGTTRQT